MQPKSQLFSKGYESCEADERNVKKEHRHWNAACRLLSIQTKILLQKTGATANITLLQKQFNSYYK